MDPRLQRSLRIHSMFLIGALVVQYTLGMYVNLFVSFPDNSSQGQLWEFAWSQPALAAHIILAILIFFGSVVLCIRAARQAARSKDRRWITCSLIGLLAVFAAGASGASFIPSQTDLYSYSMSLAFLIAIFSYGWPLITSQRVEPS